MSAEAPKAPSTMAEWQAQAAQSWKLSLPCTKAEAERLAGDLPEIETLDPQPVVMTSEPDPATPDIWRLDAYFEGEPDADAVAIVRALVPSAAGDPAVPEPIEDQDWTTLSQAFLEPIRAGRFFVHTAAHADRVPAGVTAFQVEASRAFGTGHHETTHGCLEMLDSLAAEGRNLAAIADIGTGTGLLALAARTLWPKARLLASDIDPISIEVAAEVFEGNGVPRDTMALVVAPGVDAPAIQAAAPFDLLIANILAGPLIELAPSFAAVVAPNGLVMLAGLLDLQEEAIIAAYRQQGFAPFRRGLRGEWPTVVLIR